MESRSSRIREEGRKRRQFSGVTSNPRRRRQSSLLEQELVSIILFCSTLVLSCTLDLGTRTYERLVSETLKVLSFRVIGVHSHQPFIPPEKFFLRSCHKKRKEKKF